MIYGKLFLVMVYFSLLSCSSAETKLETNTPQENKVQQKNSSEINFKEAVFIDVRTTEEYSTGTFNDAKNIPLSELAGRLNELEKQDQIVVFCKSGGRASRAASILQNAGFNQVVNGINALNLSQLQNK